MGNFCAHKIIPWLYDIYTNSSLLKHARNSGPVSGILAFFSGINAGTVKLAPSLITLCCLIAANTTPDYL
jgi:hypothetical protein